MFASQHLYAVECLYSNKNGLLIKSDEESIVVAGTGEISNFDLIKDNVKMKDYIEGDY